MPVGCFGHDAKWPGHVSDSDKKFLKKERQKDLPKGATYWDFDCKLGQSEQSAVEVRLPALAKGIDELVANNIMTIYVEITAKAIEAGESQPAQED